MPTAPEAVATAIAAIPPSAANPQQRTAQLNIRIDQALKSAGEAALAAAGYTTSQAVRALWKLAAEHRDDPEELRALLEPDTQSARAADRTAERERRRASLKRGRRLCDRLRARWGITPETADTVAATPYKELHAEALLADYRDRGLV